MSWPWLNTPESSSHFWGWAQIILGVVNFLVLGVFFAYEALPYLMHKKRRPAMFGIGMVLVSLTSGVHAVIHGVYTLNMQLVGPRGMKPLDIASLIMCFGPLPVFGLERIRLAQGKPERVVRNTPTWLIVLVGLVGLYVGGFLMRTIDVARFKHTHFAWLSFDSNYNLGLAALYLVLSAAWLNYQVRVHHRTHEWSVLGVSLGLIFVTMAFHRLAQAIEISAGVYHIRSTYEQLFRATDIASLLAAMFFLGVVISLLRRAERESTTEAVGTG